MSFGLSILALVLSAWLYVSSTTNRILSSRTLKNQTRAAVLQNQFDEFKKALASQQEKLGEINESDTARPAIVSEIGTLANWNNNPRLRELLVKHGFEQGRPAQSEK